MFKGLISRAKTIFTKEEHIEEKGKYIDFTVDDEVAIGDEIEEEKMCNSFMQLKTVEEKKRERLHAICIKTKKFRIRKKLIRRIVNSFAEEGFFDE